MIIILYDIDIVDASMAGKFSRKRVGKHSNTVRLLLYNSYICYVSNTDALFITYRCPSCDKFVENAAILERHLNYYKQRVKPVLPKNVYNIRETLFDKLALFGVSYRDKQKLFANMAIFDFIQPIWKMKILKIPKQQTGLGSISDFWYQYRPT